MKTMRFRFAWMALFVPALTGCGRPAPAPSADPPALNVTSWTTKTELYMEYPALVTGQSALFAVHLTRLDDFKPLASGHPRIEFTADGAGSKTLQGGPPSRPGAFRVEGEPPAPGTYRWALIVEAPGLEDRHDLGTVTVFRDLLTARQQSQPSHEDPTAIAYLKEQQWSNEFGTENVREADLRTSVRVPAVIEPLTGGEAVVGAPVTGRFAATTLPTIGSTVRAGDILGRLEPRTGVGEDRATLAATADEAQLGVDAARAEAARADRLLAERAVPARRAEDARRALAVAEARLKAAQARLAQRDEALRNGGGAATGNVFAVRAPISGRVVDVSATLGASYDEGAPLFRIVRTDSVELRALIPPSDVAALPQVDRIAFETPGSAVPLPLEAHHMHNSGVLDSSTHALAVQFEVSNPQGHLLIGQNGTAVLYTPRTQRVPAVPKAAVLMEAGRPYVFVHVSGERFVRRPVEIVARDGDLVGVRSGVAPGDRVVVRGAYDIQLASAAKGLPAEGHVH